MFDSIRSKLAVAGAALLAPFSAFAECVEGSLPDVGQSLLSGSLLHGLGIVAGVILVSAGAAMAFFEVRSMIRYIKRIMG